MKKFGRAVVLHEDSGAAQLKQKQNVFAIAKPHMARRALVTLARRGHARQPYLCRARGNDLAVEGVFLSHAIAFQQIPAHDVLPEFDAAGAFEISGRQAHKPSSSEFL